ncbi:MAG TPA: 3-hydroxyacyl-CoA dehydrogenase NAD-binding domain-containing protein [Alphaproteobacteria bacterium]|nr:3-hydroxyacyl-CoA dehydrogenase [Micavibrio sp.]MBK9562252.1 3-hydroxyacyl-CoA dehydrogenase [Micavibrio sp.]HQX28204.1 3-hydroxyacyl-CoA dehydrogenase NAD-binding domain-containing protein [Alphaproteobacteria bacterium]
MTIKKVAVIGSGVMGSGIAAQVSNAGLPVLLLDIVPKDAKDRSMLAKGAIEKMLKADPAPFMRKSNAKLITPGNLEDDLEELKDVDWIIEVVLEDLKIKHATYEKLNKVRKKGSIITSNTSTIPLHKLVEGIGKDFEKDFMITHFFNPPRYMRLLELVVGKNTRPDAVETIREICDVKLGKGVVQCNDTPGFIANRLGVFWLTVAVNEAVNQKISIEAADAIMSKPVGIPKTGIFGLIDLVGIDLMPKLSASLLSTLEKDDPYRKIFVDHPFVHGMIKEGYTGRKGKGGFYRLNPDPAVKKEKQALKINAASFSESQYVKSDKPKLASMDAGKQGLKAVLTHEDIGGKYAWKVLNQTLAYAAFLVPEVADTIVEVDDGMKLGYNWKSGPFEMMDALGPAWLAGKLKEEGIEVPALLKKVGDGTFYRIENGKRQYFGTDGKYHDVKRPDGVLLLSDIKLSAKPVLKNGSAKVWDVGDGVLCFEKTSKMNTFDEQIFDLLEETIKLIGDGKKQYKALVVYNEASNFSAGANLGVAAFMINIAMWPQVEEFVARGQRVFMGLKFAPFPVVSAPSGLALGGGCEILLASDAVQPHAETYTGLVEVGVGIIPGWGGCKEMVLRFRERERAQFAKSLGKVGKKNLWFSPDVTPMGAARKAFETIGTAQVAKSAFEAVDLGYFRESDNVTMNRDRLLYDAKQRALGLAKDYKPPVKADDIRLPGAGGKMALDLAVGDLKKSGKATPYDIVVSDALANVLTGGKKGDWTVKLTEDDLLKLELSEFMKLLHNDGTLARIEYMLDNGKPLRN